MRILCNKCGYYKDMIKDFARDRAQKTGRHCTCRVCNKKRAKLWRENNQEHIKAYNLKRKEG